jgi:hypothetical protein
MLLLIGWSGAGLNARAEIVVTKELKRKAARPHVPAQNAPLFLLRRFQPDQRQSRIAENLHRYADFGVFLA